MSSRFVRTGTGVRPVSVTLHGKETGLGSAASSRLCRPPPKAISRSEYQVQIKFVKTRMVLQFGAGKEEKERRANESAEHRAVKMIPALPKT